MLYVRCIPRGTRRGTCTNMSDHDFELHFLGTKRSALVAGLQSCDCPPSRTPEHSHPPSRTPDTHFHSSMSETAIISSATASGGASMTSGNNSAISTDKS